MEIIIYSMLSCTRCKILEMLLNKKNIEHTLIVDNPPSIEGAYPHIYIDDTKINYLIVMKKIKEGEIK